MDIEVASTAKCGSGADGHAREPPAAFAVRKYALMMIDGGPVPAPER